MDDVGQSLSYAVVREQAPATKPRPSFLGVQALRAIAAMLVVAMHADETWHLRIDPRHSLDFWRTGAAGVDIFFVISGFVMVVSTQQLVRTRDWRAFVWRRFSRIVPLYWVATTLKVVSVLVFPALALRTVLTPGYVAASYFFLPWRDAAGDVSTVLPVGWTLNLEMAFYVLFAVALAAGVGLLRVILPFLVVAAALAPFVTPGWPAIAMYCDPIVLEFAAGLCLGLLTLRGRVLPAAPAAIALVGGFALLLFVPPVLPRLLSWGVPAILIMAGTVGLEAPLRRRLPRWLLTLGAASYSIYLFHAFILAALGVALQRIPMPLSVSFVLAIAIGCVLSAVVGEFCRRALERPLLVACQRLNRTDRTAAA